MYLKFPFRDLNQPYPPHPTNTYTCEKTIALRMRGGEMIVY